jgi:FAD/FMN-containing dehydrogenase
MRALAIESSTVRASQGNTQPYCDLNATTDAGLAALKELGTASPRIECEAAERARRQPLKLNIDGTILEDAASCRTAAEDFGHLVRDVPRAVVRPGSIDDVERSVAYANACGLPVAMRGGAHSVLGQAQAAGGMVIEASRLCRIHSVTEDAIVVDAGARWLDVVRSAYAKHRVPAIVPGHLDRTVGGVLAVGGITGAAHRLGLAADNVLELEVVTGSGERTVCSPTRESELFDAALAGCGQHAIIVRATLPLCRWRNEVRTYSLVYGGLEDLLHAHGMLAKAGRFDHLRAAIVTAPQGRWSYLLQAAIFWDRATPPRDEEMLQGMREGALETTTQDKTFKAWLFRMVGTTHYLKGASLWAVPHPWLDLLIPDHAARAYLDQMLRGLNADETAGLPISLIALSPGNIARTLFKMPEADLSFALSVPFFTRAEAPSMQTMVARNRKLFELAQDCGGKRQASGAIPFSVRDWRAHFGERYGALLACKHLYDPNGVLTPGYGMFGWRRSPAERMGGLE